LAVILLVKDNLGRRRKIHCCRSHKQCFPRK